MPFDSLIGKENIKEIFKKMLENGKLPNALLFTGNNGSGKLTFAFALTKALFCQNAINDFCDTCKQCNKINRYYHSDVRYIFPKPTKLIDEKISELLKEKADDKKFVISFDKGTSIQIDEIRELKRWVRQNPFESDKKVIIIENAEKMTVQATNSLLKILEEPPRNTYFILLCENYDQLLDTIKSRCIKLKFLSYKDEDTYEFLKDNFNFREEEYKKIAKLSEGNFVRAIDFANLQEKDSFNFLTFFENSLKNNKLIDLLNFCDNLKTNKERDKIIVILEDLYFYFYNLLTKDIKDEKKINLEDFEKIFIEIEKTKDYILHNVSIESALFVLFSKIFNIINGEEK